MATNPANAKSQTSVIHWLLDSDPSIRWQVMRDLTDAPAHEVAAERAKVATEGAGARLLALQAPDGRWGGLPGTAGGTPRCTSCRSYGRWVSIPRATRRAALLVLSATG
jgi:hypothetical protein